jgi:hypothetical protein
MVINIFVGTMMMVLTTVVHSVAMVTSFDLLDRWSHHEHRHGRPFRLMMVSGTILIYFGAALFEVAMWAAAYLTLGAVQGVENSLYFSMVTFTTLGYGDIFLNEQWRLLASFEAANGIIMFGWTTAVVMAVVQRTYAKVIERIHGKRRSSG